MNPVSFSEHEQLATSPNPNVQDLPLLQAHVNGLGPGNFSCWRFTWSELLRVLFTRRIYLCVIAQIQPQIAIDANPEAFKIKHIERQYADEAV